MTKLIIPILGLVLLAVAPLGCYIEGEDGEGEKVEISAECNWYYGVECELACETTESHLECQGGCEGEFDLPSCKASCEAECVQYECDVDPGGFDCEGYCGFECGAHCEGQCEASENQASCEGSCAAFCESECELSCDYDPTEIDCEGGCDASCEGSCEGGKVDIDCYVDCDANMPIECKGGCEDEGFLECDGQFIDKQDLEAAIAWVENNWDGEVTFEGDAECKGNACYAEGSCEASCVSAHPRGIGAGSALLLVLVAGLLAVFRRR